MEGERGPRGQQPVCTPAELINLMDTISYFVQLKMHVTEKNLTFTVPPEVDRIIELARGLPTPRPDEWGSLALGTVSTKRKFGANRMEESKGPKRPRDRVSDEGNQRQYDELTTDRKASAAIWEDHEKSVDLIRLVQNASYRERMLGTQDVAWHAIARHLGVAEESARDEYRRMTTR